MDLAIRMQAIVLSFTAGTGGAAVQVASPGYSAAPVYQPVSHYDSDYRRDDYGPPATFFTELDGAGDWYQDDSYGAVFVPSRPRSAPCYQNTARYGSWIDRPAQGRVWVPEQRFRRHVVERVRPHFRPVTVVGHRPSHSGYVREQRERARLLRYLNELSAREWRRLERSGANNWERQRLYERQQRRLAHELRRLEMKQTRRRH